MMKLLQGRLEWWHMICMFWSIFFSTCVITALDEEECSMALGMESGYIKDDEITASSSYDVSSVGPQNARIRKEYRGGAWCPKRPIVSTVKEYLEIDLRTLTVITAVETMGRFGNGQGKEYAEYYMLEYWRPTMPRWIRFRNRTGEEIFQGNKNTYDGVKRKVSPPIIASRIRFVPYSNLQRMVCMRVELFGCSWPSGLISYSMPQGEVRGADINLKDKTYDGINEENYLYDGLGQLIDGQRGQDNFRLDSYGLGKGYEWVGWKNDTLAPRPVQIVFEFKEVQNFTSLHLYCNNLFTKEVRVFAKAVLTFSIGGRHFNGEPVIYSYVPDDLLETARDVVIRMKNKIGRFVKVELYFGSKWILISEVSFDSVTAVGHFVEETESIPFVPPVIEGESDDIDETLDSEVSSAVNDQSIGLVIGVLTAVIVLLVLIIFIIIRHNRQSKQTTNHAKLQRMEKHVTINMKDLRMNFNVTTCSNSNQVHNSIYGKMALEDSDQDKTYYYEPYKIYHEPYNSSTITYDMKKKLSELSQGSDYTVSVASNEYAVPDITKTGPSVPMLPRSNPPEIPKPPIFLPPSSHRHPVSAGFLLKMQNIQGVSGSTVYAVPNAAELTRNESRIDGFPEFPRSRLKFVEKIGEGQFGEVHLCEVEGSPQVMDLLKYEKRKLVAVKVLRMNATDLARSDFRKEMEILSQLKDPNIIQVLGVCISDDPLCIILEYMENGDLNQYLHQHVPEMSSTKSSTLKTLNYGSLIHMATQIASGMKYLESISFVHRDLATRNCLVGSTYKIKIADFGMSRNLYSSDYYQVEGRTVLPIRWMAWESILLGKFSSKSDVWAFGVTLWEILTFARDQPYHHLSDEKVIENVGHFYHSDGLHVHLPQPATCPKEIYDLMMQCWQRIDTDRPTFSEIHLFLQRKNLGYKPEVPV